MGIIINESISGLLQIYATAAVLQLLLLPYRAPTHRHILLATLLVRSHYIGESR